MAKKSAAKKPVAKKSTGKASAKSPVAVAVPIDLPRVQPLVVLFVIFHVLAITLYALPKPSDQVLKHIVQPRGSDAMLMFNENEMKNWAPVYGYLYTTGFWQYWDMFAPDPSQTDVWCDAEVVFLDGTKANFAYPRIKSLPLQEKFMRERHRKFYERVNSDLTPFFWPPFAQAIALQMATDPNDPPVQITLIRHFQVVAKHNVPGPAEPPYENFRYFTYVVDQHKLFEEKGWKFGLH